MTAALHASATGAEPDWKGLYLELGTSVSAYLRVCDRVKLGEADGGDYWAAYGAMEKLLGAALCWRDEPELYAEALKRQAAARAHDAHQQQRGEGG